MDVVNLSACRLREAPWNPNRMDEAMQERLRESVARYGFLEALVVRPIDEGSYEVLGGNQRLNVLKGMGVSQVPCVVVKVGDAQAQLLAQALNRVEGVDDLGLKAELVREVLKAIPESDVLAVLPESAESLAALASLGEADLAQHLQAWEEAQAARLHYFTAQLSADQLEVVEEAMEQVTASVTHSDTNPNSRGNALFTVCLDYLDRSQSQ